MAIPSADQLPMHRNNVEMAKSLLTDSCTVTARNALRHGLSGAGLLLPAAEASRAAHLEAQLRREHNPRTTTESLLLKQMAVYDVKADQARALQIEVRAQRIERAETFWDDDRRMEILEVAKTLHEAPEYTVQKLLASFQGATWLLGRWALLLKAIEKAGDWDETQRALAIDLIGVPPEFRSVLPIEIDSPDPEEQKRLRLTLAKAEQTRLAELIDRHFRVLDASDRIRAVSGVEATLDQELRLLRRYERDAQRRHERAWSEFKKLRRAAAAESETKQTKQDEFDAAFPNNDLDWPDTASRDRDHLDHDDHREPAEEPLPSQQSDQKPLPAALLTGNRQFGRSTLAQRREAMRSTSNASLSANA